MDSVGLLERLVGFPTVSARSNLALIGFVRDVLAERGIEARLLPDATGEKASLFVTIGPRETPGIMLSGHTDVVPTEGQAWTADPFVLAERDGRLYGRGTADMKGFLACALRAADLASRKPLATPLHLALSYDEEIGCVGVRPMLDMLAAAPRPRLVIVGEPTSLALALGHKGKVAARATCCGIAAHSALAPHGLNAIHLAADFVAALRRRQAALAAEGARDEAYDVPYTTVHAGLIRGGTALNIVPDRAEVDFEIRNLAADDATAILSAITEDAAAIAAPHRRRFPAAAVCVEVVNDYPGLDEAAESEAAAFMRGLLDAPAITKVAFGTEGGLFRERLGVPVVVCGPGSMDQGHKPDEFVSRAQIEACDGMMDRLVERLAR
ncbi:acetylornithine deacetylase [Labrys wisconsinensis]|uniref:Acetylornithine deacetylase n=1 Tax=Labrys wisconsinensis TaxID=425677 RepID=A0ABU0J8V8_9HYPH|nr:acetylornithine deacetylase [Labrys wisconsinensis]MDQ0469592.1 acetylornithine deacetylase [Labrys wisconsinensis]